MWQARQNDLPAIYGKNIAELEAEWHGVIGNADATEIKYNVDRR